MERVLSLLLFQVVVLGGGVLLLWLIGYVTSRPLTEGWLTRIEEAIGEPGLRLQISGTIGEQVYLRMPGGPEAFSLDCLRTEEVPIRIEGSRVILPTPDAQIHPFETYFAVRGDQDLARVVLDPALKQGLVSAVTDWRFGPIQYAEGTLSTTIKGGRGAASQIEACARQMVALMARLREGATRAALLTQASGAGDGDRSLAARPGPLREAPSPQRDALIDVLQRSSDPLERLVWTLERGDEALLSAELERQIDPARAPAIARELDRHRLSDLPAPRRRLLGLRLLVAGGVILRGLGLELVRSSCGPGDAEAERALLGLKDPNDEDERLTLIQALGQVAGVAAVPRLEQLARRGGGETTPRARAAIREIQARAVGAEAGAVRLATHLPDEGAIRFEDEAARGAVRLARERQGGEGAG